MRTATLDAVGETLLSAGYLALPDPFMIGAVKFESLSAYVGGPGSLELVLVVGSNTRNAKSRAETRWLVERVARALDAIHSRRPLSTVLVADETLPTELLNSILRVSRVVPVNGEIDPTLQLAPLLPLDPLTLSTSDTDAREGLLPFLEGSKDASQFRRLISDASTGASNVESRLATWLEKSFSSREGNR